MGPTPHDDERPLRSDGADAAAPADGAAALLARALRGEPLEGALCALAAGPAGAGFARAWLLAWSPREERFEGAALNGDESADAARAWRTSALPAARLDALSARAWSGGGVACGARPGVSLPWGASAHVGAVALRRGGRRWGLLVGAWEEEPAAAALEAFARFAEVALEVRDGVARARRRGAQADALAELAAAADACAHVAETLRAAARLAAQATAAAGAVVWRAAEDGAPRLEVTHGAGGRRERIATALTPLAAAAMAERRAIVLDRALDERRLDAESAAGLSALAVLPLVAEGRVLGALAVYDPAPAHPGDAGLLDGGDLRCLEALAALGAQTVARAESHAAVRAAEQRQHELRARLAREERLAALGEAALRTANEARHPLASIAAFARRVLRELPDGEAARESLEIVLREVARLERLLADTLAEAPPEPTRLRVESVNRSVQEALQAAGETLVRRRVRLVKKLAPDLPPLLLDAERVRRVLDNLLARALESVPVGGRVRVESRRLGPRVEVDIAHDGPRAPGDLLDHLFVPFAGDGPVATPEAGLGVAARIIREHGGEIRVRTEGDWTNVVSFALPVADNQDRRRGGTDRRQRRAERRRAAG